MNAFEAWKERANQPFLTKRELEILGLRVARYSNKEIASMLGLSVKTVESHLHIARRVLGRRSLRGLAEWLEMRGGVF